MGNKEKILVEARTQLNANGLAAVTARSICKALGLSPGSFSYHFPDSSAIVETLYQQMRAEESTILAEFAQLEPSILGYLNIHQALFEVQLTYRFFYANLSEILAKYPNIKSQFVQRIQTDRMMARQSIQHFMEIGVLRAYLTAAQIDRMVNVGQILHHFWSLDAQIMEEAALPMSKRHYLNLCCGLLEPFLMPASLDAYREFFDALDETKVL
ncbi:TetR/AcrR family transcriptional regulator [Pontibacter sp. G13]|uniref:TetR/AcrR family transcriptional regulator n=1 Tax=Pontibacter sp. G13 TaxID=3074898 RepID=UPI00288C5F7D|nr:TetR/AcrR family transcriptional regulator [Pontibacter sp. G13]WNJ18435.1 TetR/AcrR family transcriptional regulator [Pontibacter sp. G13]